MKVAISHAPSGKSVIGPRSTLWRPWPRNPGRSAKPATGTVTMPPISAPSPTVMLSRKRLRGYRSAVGTGRPSATALAASRFSASTATCSSWCRCIASRIQRNPKMIVITAPIEPISSGSMMRPTRMTAMPTANPSG